MTDKPTPVSVDTLIGQFGTMLEEAVARGLSMPMGIATGDYAGNVTMHTMGPFVPPPVLYATARQIVHQHAPLWVCLLADAYMASATEEEAAEAQSGDAYHAFMEGRGHQCITATWVPLMGNPVSICLPYEVEGTRVRYLPDMVVDTRFTPGKEPAVVGGEAVAHMQATLLTAAWARWN